MTRDEDQQTISRGFLGRGWSFPPEFDHLAGDVVMTTDAEDIEASLRILFGTSLGERFLSPNFGLDLHGFQFEPMNTTARTLLKDQIRIAILVYEPRIALLDLDVVSPSQDGRLEILVEYRVRATNSRYNLVYPFYIGDASEVAVRTPRGA